eukprot:TRINITY_DN3724_c0_g1_i3.p2 TRINITY_DN3724_c0_g1~~TRINITY_DN3724_c0_g1_i3.p2  ORF type:complete len:235 (+),score=66.30 TRINITY_DN3724_c0_g1_i3:623-1327(+)
MGCDWDMLFDIYIQSTFLGLHVLLYCAIPESWIDYKRSSCLQRGGVFEFELDDASEANKNGEEVKSSTRKSSLPEPPKLEGDFGVRWSLTGLAKIDRPIAVLLPGPGCSRESCLAVANVLKKKFFCVSIDAMGCGEAIDQNFDLDKSADEIIRLIRSLSLTGKAYVVAQAGATDLAYRMMVKDAKVFQGLVADAAYRGQLEGGPCSWIETFFIRAEKLLIRILIWTSQLMKSSD